MPVVTAHISAFSVWPNFRLPLTLKGTRYRIVGFGSFQVFLEILISNFQINTPSVKMIVANANPGNMSKVCYILQLSAYLYRDGANPVGNYTCRSVQNPNKSSSQYIFADCKLKF